MLIILTFHTDILSYLLVLDVDDCAMHSGLIVLRRYRMYDIRKYLRVKTAEGW